MATTYWFAWRLRVVHGLEILVDEMLYALVLGLLFAPRNAVGSTEQQRASTGPDLGGK
jgi:hypothetical protein